MRRILLGAAGDDDVLELIESHIGPEARLNTACRREQM